MFSPFISGRRKEENMSDYYNEREGAAADGFENTREQISFRILEHLGVLRVSASGWTRELNYISWNNKPAKYDIREWTPDHKKGTRGITLTDHEMGRVCEWVAKRNAQNAALEETQAGA